MSRAATLAALVTAIAPLASPVLSGNPTAPTPSPGDNDTSIATTAFIQNLAAALATLASPTFSGDPKGPTASPGDNDTSLATTGFVAAALAALSTVPLETVGSWTWSTNVNNITFTTGLTNSAVILALFSSVTSTGITFETSSNGGANWTPALSLASGTLLTRSGLVLITGSNNANLLTTASAIFPSAEGVLTVGGDVGVASLTNALRFKPISGNFTVAGRVVLLGLRG